MPSNSETLRLAGDEIGLNSAASLLREGNLVAFSTETVYGLGADATNDKAVAEIFSVKGRPEFNPLIVHVGQVEEAQSLSVWSDKAETLAAAFWPGALTLVLPRAEGCPVSELASAGLPSLALRVPASELAREMIGRAECPVAAPSANRSGLLSPTTCGHVLEQLDGRIAAVLDGGDCLIGVESTVLDLTSGEPVLLRPGGIPVETLSEQIGKITIADEGSEVRSPGMLARHYAPTTPIRLNAHDAKLGEAFIGFGGAHPEHPFNLSPSGDLIEAAANLFKILHAVDRGGFSSIAVAPIPETGLGLAINDRLRRAASSD